MKIVLVANTAWYLYNYRLSLARALQDEGAELFLVSPPDSYARLLKEKGFEWMPLSMTRRGFNPLVEFRTLIALTRMYQKLQPDVVHHFTTKPVIYGSLAARWNRVPLILNAITGLGYLFIRGGWLGSVLRSLAGILYRLSLHVPSIKIIFQNKSDMQVFTDAGWIRPEQAFYIPGSGVDTQQFSPAPEPEGIPIVLMAGRMLWDKGVTEFVKAAEQLNADGLKAVFRLVGGTDPGNPAAIPEEVLQGWSESGTIEWLGQQDNMPEIYADSTIVVLPTSYREGLPRTLIEAASVGRPLIATDIPGCRDVVRDGINGYLVPLKDTVALSNAIEKLLDRPELRRKMGQAGREIVIKEYSNATIVHATLALYPHNLAHKPEEAAER